MDTERMPAATPPSLLLDVREWASATPGAVAIRSSDATTTYAQLMSDVDRARTQLISVGVRPATVVRITGRVDAAMLAVLLAAWSLRSVVWLVGDASAVEATGATTRCAAPLVVEVTSDPASGLHFAGCARLNPDDHAAVQDVARHSSRRDDHPGYLVHSSGSTGRRKYILGSYRGLSEFVRWQRDTFVIGPGDVVAHLTDVSFDVVYRELLTPLVSGATVLLPPAGLVPGAVLAHLADTGTTVVNAVPSVARMWMDGALHRVNAPRLGLRRSFFAGEPLDGTFAHNWRALADDHEVVNLYGPTETTLAAFHWRVPPDHSERHCPVGRPIAEVDFSVVEPGGTSPVVAGAVGEVVIRARHGSYGYLGPDAGAFGDVLVFEDGAARFRTGDLGRVRDGQLELVGRVGMTMKVNGRWVDRAAIESVLRDLAQVTEAVVLPVRGPHGTRLSAFVATNGELDRHQARQAILTNLGWTAIPTQIETMAELPRLPSGKIAVGALARRGTATTGDSEGRVSGMPVGPTGVRESSIEDCLTRHATHLLGQEVGAESNLLDAGLDSLGALELCGVIEEQYLVECAPEEVLDHPVVSELAHLVATRAVASGSCG